MFIIAFTKTSVPSLPTLESFSTQPESLSFSTILNCKSKDSDSVRVDFLDFSSSLTNCFNNSTAF